MEIILVTGAAGYIGRQLLPKLPKKKVLCLVERGQKVPGYKSLEADIVTGWNLEKLPKNIKTVVHLAGNADMNAGDYVVNDWGTENLLGQIPNFGRGKCFILASSIAVWGGRVKCDRPMQVGVGEKATNAYGRSKVRAENIVLRWAKDRGFSPVILRIAPVMGRIPKIGSVFTDAPRIQNSWLAKIDWPGRFAVASMECVIGDMLTAISSGRRQIKIVADANLQMADIFGMKPAVRVPGVMWRMVRRLRPLIYNSEKLMPKKWYAWAWRAGIIVDDVVWAEL